MEFGKKAPLVRIDDVGGERGKTYGGVYLLAHKNDEDDAIGLVPLGGEDQYIPVCSEIECPDQMNEKADASWLGQKLALEAYGVPFGVRQSDDEVCDEDLEHGEDTLCRGGSIVGSGLQKG